MDYREELLGIFKEMQRESMGLHKTIRKYPKGTISISTYKQYVKVCRMQREDAIWKKRGITNKHELIRTLLQKANDIERVKRIDANIKILSEILDKIEDTSETGILEAMPANFDLLPSNLRAFRSLNAHPIFDNSISAKIYKPFLTENEKEEFLYMPYLANSMNLTEKRQTNAEGIAFRSKSELSIYEIYKELGCCIKKSSRRTPLKRLIWPLNTSILKADALLFASALFFLKLFDFIIYRFIWVFLAFLFF